MYKRLYRATRVFRFRITILRQFQVFAVTLLSVVWYNGTRTVMSWTKNIQIENVTLNIRAFSV